METKGRSLQRLGSKAGYDAEWGVGTPQWVRIFARSQRHCRALLGAQTTGQRTPSSVYPL